MKTSVLFILFFFLANLVDAQVVANAGPDYHSCPDDPNVDFISIGGSPTAQYGTPPYTYEWSMEDIIAGGGCSYVIIQTADVLEDIHTSNPRITDRFSAERIEFYLKVTDANGSEAFDTCIVSFSNFIFNQSYYSYHINLGDSVLLNQPINVTGGVPPVTYHWQPEEGLSATQFESFFWAKPSQTTFYYVTITDAMGCQATGTPYYNVIVNTTGINETEETSHVKIYPNPVDHFMRIMNETGIPIINVNIFDLHGKIIQQLDPNSSIFDLQNLSSGLYLIHIQTIKSTIVQKIQKL